MNSTEFLKHLITEELFILPDLEKVSAKIPDIHSYQKESLLSSTSPIPNEVETVNVSLLIEAKINDRAERALLQKVISSVGFQMDQVTLIEPGTQHHFKSNKAILFGDENTDFYIVKSNEKGEEILSSCSLSTLSKSLEDKKSLWAALKSWFEV